MNISMTHSNFQNGIIIQVASKSNNCCHRNSVSVCSPLIRKATYMNDDTCTYNHPPCFVCDGSKWHQTLLWRWSHDTSPWKWNIIQSPLGFYRWLFLRAWTWSIIDRWICTDMTQNSANDILNGVFFKTYNSEFVVILSICFSSPPSTYTVRLHFLCTK